MRESNFAFPAQNKACVCITSQLYDRRALDTLSPLPLFNSLTHLTYLTSTSPRIREIMTMDGGLERLVRMLHDFCISPPPPDNPAILYGLLPPSARPSKLAPVLNPTNFDKHAAYRFSLGFQCLVNIGVRGSEPIRSRVVQAGTLDVVGCILEAWLAGKGFVPGTGAAGGSRETREQRQARRSAIQARQQATQAAVVLQMQVRAQREAERAHRRSIRNDEEEDASGYIQEDESMEITTDLSLSLNLTLQPTDPSSSHMQSLATRNNSDTDLSTDASTAATPLGSGTPTGSVVIPARDRSGTIIARPVWDPQVNPPQHPRGIPVQNLNSVATTILASSSTATLRTGGTSPSSSHSASTSRPETETEDDGDIDMSYEADDSMSVSGDPSSAPTHPAPLPPQPHQRRAVGIVSDDPSPQGQEVSVGEARIVDVDVGGGVEDGIVSLEQNDDFAMGAPPGAPGALEPVRVDVVERAEGRRRHTVAGGEGQDVTATPRAVVVGLPIPPPAGTTPRQQIQAQPLVASQRLQNATIRPTPQPQPVPVQRHHHHHHHHDVGPYRDEDVLLSLQLLAYLSKYPHVRQAFYKPRMSFHPACTSSSASSAVVKEGKERQGKQRELPPPTQGKGKDSTSWKFPPSGSSSSTTTARGKERSSTTQGQKHTNVFSLVERFTYKPSANEGPDAPRLPPEIQYWAGVIMRNACRKDESRGGIRQCANMLCGKWESYPREFAKCRRCRKAKYCGKECQSTAWSEGHRFWCSAKDVDDADTGTREDGHHHHHRERGEQGAEIPISEHGDGQPEAVVVSNEARRRERREARERERERERGERERGERERGEGRGASDGDTATVRGGYTTRGVGTGTVWPPQTMLQRQRPATAGAVSPQAGTGEEMDVSLRL